jgi:deazaflavin-dependent oxidoreductase (nitroreductase family)
LSVTTSRGRLNHPTDPATHQPASSRRSGPFAPANGHASERMLEDVKIINRLVKAVLVSPLHRLLSGSTAVIRYSGRRSGHQYSTPVQYAPDGDDVIVLAGRHETKTWWRNFTTGHDAEVLLDGDWQSMTGTAVVGTGEPDRADELRNGYLARFPKAAKTLGAAGDPAVAVMLVFEPHRNAAEPS